MLLSQACSLGRATSLGQPRQRQPFERSSSGCFHGAPPPAPITRTTSGPVHVQAYSGSTSHDVLATPARKPDAAPETRQTSACIAFPETRQRSTKQEFQANFGTAIRVLRDDIPCTLQRSPDMEIFASNIIFMDNISPKLGHQTNRIQGLDAYGRQMWSLRFHAALLFSKSHVEVMRLWQRDDRTVAVRWTVRCSPRLIGGVTGGQFRLDGISEYKFNDEGKVCSHSIDVVNWDGLHNMLGLRSLQLNRSMAPTPSVF